MHCPKHGKNIFKKKEKWSLSKFEKSNHKDGKVTPIVVHLIKSSLNYTSYPSYKDEKDDFVKEEDSSKKSFPVKNWKKQYHRF